MPQEDYPQEGKDHALKKTCCEALGGINKAPFDVAFGEEVDSDSVWDSVCIVPVDSSNADEHLFGMYGAENISDAAKACARAGQRVMAEKLTGHFLFEFDCNDFKLFPEIYGGFANDGSVVGILRARQMDA